MPRLQQLLQGLLSTLGDVSEGQVAKASALVLGLGPLHKSVYETYRVLGGIQDAPTIRPGNWDIEFDGVAVELDEQLHFNEYRALTLQSDLYTRLSAFPLGAYRKFCNEHQPDCIRAGSHGNRWTNSGSEAQFGPAGPLGQLAGCGAPRWKQRAFYDFVKDAAGLVSSVRVVRLSIWEPVVWGGNSGTIQDLIDHPGTDGARTLAEAIRRRAGR